MILARGALDGYSQEVNGIAEAARSYAVRAYDDMRASFPSADVADVREGVKSIVEEATSAFGSAAGEVSAEMYDAMADASGANVPPADVPDIDAATVDAIDSRARYVVRVLSCDREDI